MNETVNPYERLRRLEKATKLADALAAAGIEAHLLENLQRPAEFWAAAAAKAGVNPASEETRNLVITMLRNRERVVKTDPFRQFKEAS